jgi:tripartite-type tricarboxylate transporter receptor subunit TctC
MTLWFLKKRDTLEVSTVASMTIYGQVMVKTISMMEGYKMRTTGSKMISRFVFVFVLLSSIEFSVIQVYAAGSEYPSRPITLIVSFPMGGAGDLSGRAVAEALEKHLKQPVVVVTKPGGAQTIGGYAVATAKPDGYTLGMFTVASSIPEVFTYFYEAPYSSKDLKSICRILEPVPVIAVKGDAPWNNLKDFVEYARKNPGMKWGTHGKSSLGYLSMVTINKSEKINLVHVPLEGDAKIIPAILGGHIPAGTPIYPAIKSLLDGKKLKALAFCLEKRVDFAPEVPTMVELGYKLAYVSHFGLFGPKECQMRWLEKSTKLHGRFLKNKTLEPRLAC